MSHSAPRGKSPAVLVIVAVLLAAAVAGALWVPIYARFRPMLGVFPFFYWYQLVLVPVVALLCWVCYLLLRTSPPANRGRDDLRARR